MKASFLSPSPMPKTLLAAYRKPMELFQLAVSNTMLSETEKRMVRWRLAMAADRMFGPLEISWYDIDGEFVEGSLLELVLKSHDGRASSIQPTAIIGEIVRHEDVSRKIDVVAALASILQPYWARTWEKFSRGHDSDEDVSMVVGQPQLQWIRVQIAKFQIRKEGVKPSDFAKDVLRGSEKYALELAKDKNARRPTFDDDQLTAELNQSRAVGLVLAKLIIGDDRYSVGEALKRMAGPEDPEEEEQLRSLFARCFGDHPPELTAEGWQNSLYIQE